MEMCHKLPGTNIDDVSNALQLGSKRLISNAYMRGGMGDGGGCHPRDNIALSWLAKKLDISNDFFDQIMMQREKQTDWFVKLILENKIDNCEIYILGKCFKPETNIVTGSPSILLENLIKEKKYDVFSWDPYIDSPFEDVKKRYNWDDPNTLHTFFIGTKHPEFTKFKFPINSIIIDPLSCLIVHLLRE